MALCYDSVGRPRTPVAVGTLHLTPEHGTNYWGINNWDRDSPERIGLYPSFSKEEKWRVLTSGIVHPVSKITDVSQFIGAGPVDMQPGDSLVVGFALIAAETADGVRAGVPACLAYWDTINRLYDPTNILAPPSGAERLTLHGVSPHPISIAAGVMTVNVSCGQPGRVRAELYDILGQKIAVLWDGFLDQGRQAIPFLLPRLSPGTVFLQLHSETMSTGMSLKIIP